VSNLEIIRYYTVSINIIYLHIKYLSLNIQKIQTHSLD